MFRQIALMVSVIMMYSAVMTGEKQISSAEEKFIKNVSQGGMMKVELGKFAVRWGFSKEVKQLGKMLVKDHTALNKEVAKLASKKKIQLAKQLDEDHKEGFDKVAGFAGREFDEEYVEAMIDAHESEIKDFEDMAEDAEDPQVKQFAIKTLPTVRKHLEQVENLKRKMKEMED